MPSNGLIFDADGVVIDMPHYEIWREAIRKYGIEGFTPQDYDGFVSGIPRRDGARNIFEHFNVPYDEYLIDELYHRKQAITEEFIEDERVGIYGTSLEFILYSINPDSKLALASSSENAAMVLRRYKVRNVVKYSGDETVYDLFDFIISGGIKPGKPDPKIFLKAAEGIDIPPEYCVVFEDAINGVQAAKRAGMYCVGIDRTGISYELREEGADIVVPDLGYFLQTGFNLILEAR